MQPNTDPAVMNSQNVGEPVLPNDGDGIVEMIILTASPEGNYGVQPLFDEPELINTIGLNLFVLGAVVGGFGRFL